MEVFTTKELATMFDVSGETIRREVERKKLKCFKVGNEARFTQYHIDEYTQIKNLGKTQKELDLEEEKEQLYKIIQEKDKLLDNIKIPTNYRQDYADYVLLLGEQWGILKYFGIILMLLTISLLLIKNLNKKLKL